MNMRKLRKLARAFYEAGHPTARLRQWDSIRAVLQQELARLNDKKANLREQFRTELEASSGQLVQGAPRPFEIPVEIRKAQRYLFAAISCLALESGAAAWISGRNGIPPIVGITIALVAAVILDATFLGVFHESGQNQKALRKLKYCALIPSSIMSGGAFIVLLLARVATGHMAADLAPYFNWALWAFSIGMLWLAGSLLAGWYVRTWSRHDEKSYDRAEREETETKTVLDELTKEAGTLSSAIQVSQGQSTMAKVARIVPVVVLFALFASSSACAPATTSGDGSVQEHAQKELRQVSPEVEIYLHGDVSFSLRDSQFQTCADKVLVNLPGIIQKWDAKRVTADIFDRDGWTPLQTFSRELPRLVIPQPVKVEGGEIGELKNVAEALDERAKEQRDGQERQARLTYSKDLTEALSGLTGNALLPPVGHKEPPCTDLNGLFSLIANSPTGKIFLHLVISDGAEGCEEGIKPVPAPSGNVALVVILVPERPDQRDQRGEPGEGYLQFEARKEQISRALPWAVVLPYFREDYNEALAEALEKAERLHTHGVRPASF